MEYLITYGLALFVILIVLAILVAIVLPTLQAPETCQFTQPGFSCSQKNHVVVADEDGNNLRLIFQLDNQQGKGVVVTGVLCSATSPANVRKSDVVLLADPQQMSAGQSRTFGGPGTDVASDIFCRSEDGTTLVLAPNSNFRGSLAITYRFDDDIAAIDRLAVATVTGIVQSE